MHCLWIVVSLLQGSHLPTQEMVDDPGWSPSVSLLRQEHVQVLQVFADLLWNNKKLLMIYL